MRPAIRAVLATLAVLASCAHQPTGGAQQDAGDAGTQVDRMVGDCRFIDVGNGVTRIEPVRDGGICDALGGLGRGQGLAPRE